MFPSTALDPATTRRALAAIRAELSTHTITVAAPVEVRDHVAGALQDPTVVEAPAPGATTFDASAFDAVVVVEGKATHQLEAWRRTGTRLYVLDTAGPIWQARLSRVGGELDETDYPHFGTHSFNALSPRATDLFYYFPYGYLFRCTGLGPINEFGHRIPRPLREYEERGDEHKVIAVFGGSAAWSLACRHEEMFAARLEARLADHCRARGLPWRFSVLNLAQHGNVVLNEMLTFLLMCHRIRPDVVIAHDGFNDLAYGMVSDTYLLDEHDLTYQHNLEDWARILHGTRDRPGTQAGPGLRVVNLPQSIVRAYVTRKLQFRRVVEASGGKFVWGVQPYVGSKRACSDVERAYLANPARKNDIYHHAYRHMAQAYEYLQGTALPPDVLRVDLHAEFGSLGADTTHFVDTMHTSPAGDERIADAYFRALQPVLVAPQSRTSCGT